MALTEFELAFYDWFNKNTVPLTTMPMSAQREAFEAGWKAARGE